MSERAVVPTRILVIDDEPAARGLLVAALRNRGHVVAEAGSGRTACAMLDGSGRFDAVVVDLIMVDGDGFGVIRRCVELSHRPRIIAVSDKGKPVSDYLFCALTRGADLALDKSESLADLVAIVEVAAGADAPSLKKLRGRLRPSTKTMRWPGPLVRDAQVRKGAKPGT